MQIGKDHTHTDTTHSLPLTRTTCKTYFVYLTETASRRIARWEEGNHCSWSCVSYLNHNLYHTIHKLHTNYNKTLLKTINHLYIILFYFFNFYSNFVYVDLDNCGVSFYVVLVHFENTFFYHCLICKNMLSTEFTTTWVKHTRWFFHSRFNFTTSKLI